jgi:polar amino acid transport system substrate-binding protein
MESHWRRPGAGSACALALLLATPLAAGAACTRPYNVPVAPLGISVLVHGDQVSGIYPRLLSTIAAKTSCRFKLSVVPRARLEAMFETGRADLLMPATQTPRRDRYGVFVPMIATRATLLSIDRKRAPVQTIKQLIERRELRVALVRGNDYGENYQALIRQLDSQGRAFMEVDVLSVARLLRAGLADVTILTPMSFTAAVKQDPRVRDILSKLRIEALEELPWHTGGVYVSRTSMGADEQALLTSELRAAYKSNEVWEEFRRYYPPEVVAASARPR